MCAFTHVKSVTVLKWLYFKAKQVLFSLRFYVSKLMISSSARRPNSKNLNCTVRTVIYFFMIYSVIF